MQVDDNFDAFLHRNVEEGTEFNDLIPEPNGNKVLIGKGDTGFSIIKMAEMVKTYSYQMKKVAAKLQTNSVEGTIENVKYFIFNHFQYKADKEDQLLRSPAYAWWIDGYDGIDCKSYSIIASCLLTEMGITHYIRRIKQPSFEPTGWTHVYVVVPIDQQKADLSKGYYTVDGTLEEDYEPVFTKKDDLLMELKHYSLNAPAKGLGVSIGSFSLDNVTSIKGLVSQLSCIGGSSYSEGTMKAILGKMEIYFNNLITRMNSAVSNGDDEAFALAVNEFYAIIELGQISSKKKLTEGWNACSSNVIKVIIKAWEYYGITVKMAMDAWLTDNFVKDMIVRGPLKTFNSTNLYKDYGMGATTVNMTVSKTVDYYDPKPKTIKKFAITQYVADASSSTTFNPLQFLEGLSTVAGSFGTGNGSTNPNSGTNTNGNGNLTPPPQTAGFGAFGWVLLAVGVGVMVKGFAGLEDKPATGKKPVAKSKAA